MGEAAQWIHGTFGISHAVQIKILASIVAILILWVLHFASARVFSPRLSDIYVRYRARKTTGYIVFLVGVVVLARIWFRGFGSLTTFLGLLSAGLAIAMKDPLTNLAGWIYLIWRRPFEVGDRVEIGPHSGDVVDIRFFQFTLLEVGRWVDADQSTGRIINIPNGMVFTHPQANYSKGFEYIWNEIPVLVTFESNWKKAKAILAEIAADRADGLSKAAEESIRRAANEFMILYSKLTPTVYTSVRDSGVMLTIRYLCEPKRRRDTAEEIWEDILRAFAECSDIEFAYPTERRFNSAVEGKPGIRSATPE